jgi:hypothetical protein
VIDSAVYNSRTTSRPNLHTTGGTEGHGCETTKVLDDEKLRRCLNEFKGVATNLNEFLLHQLHMEANKEAETASALLQKLEAVFRVNDEICKRLTAKDSVTRYSYEIGVSLAGTFWAQQVKEDVPVAMVLDAWKPPATVRFVDIQDIFNDHICYDTTKVTASLASLVSFNASLATVARKYHMFGDTQSARAALRTFLETWKWYRFASAVKNSLCKTMRLFEATWKKP